jgi:hypothetical protein
LVVLGLLEYGYNSAKIVPAEKMRIKNGGGKKCRTQISFRPLDLFFFQIHCFYAKKKKVEKLKSAAKHSFVKLSRK